MKDLMVRGREIVLAAPQMYIDVDIETDGWAGHGSMLSIGAVAPTGESFYREMKPLFDSYVFQQKQFAEEHGLERARLLDEAPHSHEVMESFKYWIVELIKRHRKRPVFTAFNAGFDFGFVQLYFIKCSISNPFGSAPFDLKSLAMALDVSWDWPRTSKSKLPAEILPAGDFTHNAREDAIYQQKLHFGLAGLLGARYSKLTL